MNYKRYVIIAGVALVAMYIVANHMKTTAPKLGLTYVGTE